MARIYMPQARRIRTLYDSGQANQQELADEYGVSQSTISSILRNRIHVDPGYKVLATTRRSKKLTWRIVRSIRKAYDDPEATIVGIARKHSLAPATVTAIVLNEIPWYDPDYKSPGIRQRSRGSASLKAKLDWDTVRKMREEYDNRYEQPYGQRPTCASLAEKYGVSVPTVNRIVRRVSWIEPRRR
jgi:transcriptional regulator with XRE-family HTH domain